MKLTFQKPHLSITTFPETELPEFTLITGVNGAGKTHLLRAIGAGDISTDIAPNPKQEIKFFDWGSLVPSDMGTTTVTNLHSERSQLLNVIRESCSHYQKNLDAIIKKYNLYTLHTGNDAWKLCTVSIEEIAQFSLTNSLTAQAICSISDKIIKQLVNSDLSKSVQDEIVNNYGAQIIHSELGHLVELVVKYAKTRLQTHQEQIDKLHDEYGRNIVVLSQSNLDDQAFSWNSGNLFQQSFSQMFLAYFELQKLNKLHKLNHDEGRNSGHVLTEEEFCKRHGSPPWDFVNEVFTNAKLDFSISYPESYTAVDFTPKLTKLSTGVEINFSDLSSGEKILMSFAFCLYYSRDDRQLIQKPKLLLFDEIDAPLHPSMSRHLINTITETLVKKHGVHVIMTTHSPSTVAIAPAESVYIMKPSEAGLHKVNKNQAIALLTAEIPTLSINFDGRRQVFVESGNDAKYYDAIYKILRSNLNSERSLTFIAVGLKNSKGEDVGSGSNQVTRIVDSLVKHGNESVFGLIDWDKKNQPKDRIVVLAHEKRYAIENCLLDPLLVAALVVLECPKFHAEIGLKELGNRTNFYNMTAEHYQTFVNNVQTKVLGSNSQPDSILVKYKGGFSLNISQEYLQSQGHNLEEKVKTAYPCLKRFNNTGLMLHVAEVILSECPNFIPMELEECLTALLNK
jgi:ABC-type Mn2+/Zn2+ transport system ATPase subunit